jgi:hypothetical protein
VLLSREARTSDSVKALNSLCRIRLLQRRDDPHQSAGPRRRPEHPGKIPSYGFSKNCFTNSTVE